MNDANPFLSYIVSRLPSDDALILDAGCGPGRFRNILKGRYVGLDNTIEPYGDAPRQVDVVGSARHLPFHSNTFDMVFTVFSLHLFSAPVLCLKEIHRVLKPGSRFLCFDYTRRTHWRICDALYPQTEVVSYNMLSGISMLEMYQAAGFRRVTLRCFLVSLSLSLPVPWPLRALLVPLLDLRAGCWVVEGIK